ncbi:MAG: ATP-dependent DNA helicase RecG [Candidatus Tectimicrobiota bacterium]
MSEAIGLVNDALQQRETINLHLEHLERPLRYARRQNFAHLAKLRDLESYVQHHVRALQELPLLPPVQAALQHLQHAVQGFDRLTLAQKQQRIQQVEQGLSQMRALLAQPTASDPAPADTPGVPASPLPAAAPVTGKPDDPLAQPVQFLKGVGPKRAALLAKMALHTVQDLLWRLPTRYEDRRHITPIGRLRWGQRETFCGTVSALQTQTARRGRPFVAILVQDESGALSCKWFQTRGAYIQERFPIGTRVVGSGIISLNAYTGSREVVHPDLEVLEADDGEQVHFGRVVPLYPLTAGLHQKTLRSLMKHVVDVYLPQVQETLPEALRRTYHLPGLAEALRQVHFPEEHVALQRLNGQETPFHQRLVFEEFFLLELGLALRHRAVQREPRAVSYTQPNRLGEALLTHLPFQLTAAQQRVLVEILEAMQRPFPMNRLIQGDVGSGKTVVAVLAMLMAVSNGFQAAIMAPTEILAEQHCTTLRTLLQPLALHVELLTSAVKGKNRQQLLERIAQGEVPMLVGTHALLYDEVQFQRLGMIVVDEQHRFGVLQRASLRRKGVTPDVLVMTATPIPRTLAMTLYGDLELSVIDELPPNRQTVRTAVLTEGRRTQAYDTIRREVNKGHQAYIVYPLIEESASLDLGAAVAMAEQLRQDVFPSFRIGLLHGRLASEDKDSIMQAFVQGALDILVSTTVIEVGVDVPNATVMLVENAEHFGLAQLHQLRGRVGRGQAQAYCLLLTGPALSKEGRQRLRVMQESTDGFYVAEQDLQIRGPGELLGTKQSGLPELRVGNVLHHSTCLEQARQAAFALLESDPELSRPEHQALVAAAQARWGGRLELAAIG